MDTKKEVYEYLKNLKPALCVLATSFENTPECAVLAYTMNEDLEVIISTNPSSRKWKNISKNNKVALTFGWDFSKPNVQLEGVAVQLIQGEAYKKYATLYFQAHPELIRYKTPETVFLIVKPTWIRSSNYSVYPPRIEEVWLELHQ